MSFVGACAVTPEPLKDQQQVKRSNADLATLRSIEFVPAKPITLPEAMARAVAFNLKRRVSEIESNIAEAQLEQSNYDMLPTLELNGKKNLSDVQVSSSNDRVAKSADATFTWNLLDLGVSYARAKQKADQVLIAREKERKALHDIIRQVNTAFWRAATGQQLMKKVSALAKDLKFAMAASRRMEKTRATDVITAVAFRREVVESVRQALSAQRELREAKTKLAELLNIRPGTDFQLVVPKESARNLRLPMSVAQMEHFALLHRPELRIEDYNERISDWQAREALYKMLPGLDVSAGQNYSSESTNLSPNWISTGLHLGMNIFNLFSGSSQVETAEHKGELARQQRLAMSLAVLTQLHIANVKFRYAAQQMRLVKEVADSDRRLTKLVATNGAFLNKDFFEAVRLATRGLRSELDEQKAFVDLVSAHADVMHAIGLDVFPGKIPLNNIAALTDAIRRVTAKWTVPAGADATTQNLPMEQLVNGLLPETEQRGTMTAATEAGGPSSPARARAETPPARPDATVTAEEHAKMAGTEAKDTSGNPADAAGKTADAGPSAGQRGPAAPDEDNYGNNAPSVVAIEEPQVAGESTVPPTLPMEQPANGSLPKKPQRGAVTATAKTNDSPSSTPDEDDTVPTPAVADASTTTTDHAKARGAKTSGTTAYAAGTADEKPSAEAAGSETDDFGNDAPSIVAIEKPQATKAKSTAPNDPAASGAKESTAAKAVGEPDAAAGDIAALDDATTTVSDRLVRRLNRIAPASRGGSPALAAVERGWELMPGTSLHLTDLSTKHTAMPARRRFVASLGAFRQQDNAFKLHRKVMAGSQDLLDNAGIHVVLRLSESGTSYYFVQSDPMESRRAAGRLCKSLKRSGHACYVSKLPD